MPRVTNVSASVPALLCAVLALTPAAGCLFDSHGDGPPPDHTCGVATSYDIDTGASIDHVAGVDAGYYVEYRGGGAWHLEWTCDTAVSAFGCNFTGTIVATLAPDSSVTCAQCEADDILTTTPAGTQTEIDFDTVTTTGIDGIDFVTQVGSTVHAGLLLDHLYQTDLVFLPSGGQTTNPSCLPIELVPGPETAAVSHLARPQR